MTMLSHADGEKGTGPIDRNGPEGAAHQLDLSPFLLELSQLIGHLADDDLAEADHDRLVEILRSDPAARAYYLDAMEIHARLTWKQVERLEKAESGRWKVEEKAERLLDSDSSLSLSPPLPLSPSPFPPSPFPLPHSVSLSSFLPTTPLGNVAFSYAMSALLVCIGLFIFSLMSASSPRDAIVKNPIDHRNQTTANIPSLTPEPELVSIGRITGMVDCVWVNPSEAPFHNKIKLHDKFALKSGLMEITYHTGAKVILQGPCTYEVESAAGGFLSLGKLTARVESRSRLPSGTLPTDRGDSKSRPAGGTYFAIRTPTAMVTDLGTEFGVEVAEDGATESCVLRGSVNVRLVSDSGGPVGDAIVLGKKESVRVEKKKSGTDENQPSLVIRRITAATEKFVRKMPKPLPMRVLAYFRMGEDDPGAKAGSPAGNQTFSHDGTLRLERHGSPSYVADVAAPGSTLAMSFRGSAGEYYSCSKFNAASAITDRFIFEAWIKPTEIKNRFGTLFYNGHSAYNGYGLQDLGNRVRTLLGGVDDRDPGVSCEPGRWTHVALVRENGKLWLWINGQAVGGDRSYVLRLPDGPLCIGGNPNNATESFHGLIDEVRLSVFVGPFQKEMLLLPDDGASKPVLTKTSL